MTQQSIMRDNLEKLKSEFISAKESSKHLQQTITQRKAQIANLKRKLAQDDISQAMLDEVTANLKQAEATMENIKKETNFDQIQQDIKAQHELIEQYEESIQALNDESMALNRQGDSRTRLSLKRAEKDEKTTLFNKLYEECDHDATALFGYVPDIDSFDRRVSEFIKEKKAELECLGDQKTSALKQISTAGAILNASNNKAKKLTDEIKGKTIALCQGLLLILLLNHSDKKVD
jgi:DNA repair protein RAD50